MFTMSALDTSVTWRRKHVRGAFATSSLKTQVRGDRHGGAVQLARVSSTD